MTQNMAQPVARIKSQPQRVVDSIQTRIFDGLLKPGDKLPPEPDLMREYGVSRTVVREAMSSLQASGLVKTRHGVGTFVQERPAAPLLPPQPVLHARQRLAMLELRISLESEAAYLAAQRRTPAQLEVMRQALDQYQHHYAAGERTSKDDYNFHMEVAHATHNQYFAEVLATLGSATMRVHEEGASPAHEGSAPAHFGDPLPMLSDSKQIAMREHEAVWQAIARGDAAAAKSAMLAHLDNSRARLLRKLSVVA